MTQTKKRKRKYIYIYILKKGNKYHEKTFTTDTADMLYTDSYDLMSAIEDYWSGEVDDPMDNTWCNFSALLEKAEKFYDIDSTTDEEDLQEICEDFLDAVIESWTDIADLHRSYGSDFLGYDYTELIGSDYESFVEFYGELCPDGEYIDEDMYDIAKEKAERMETFFETKDEFERFYKKYYE